MGIRKEGTINRLLHEKNEHRYPCLVFTLHMRIYTLLAFETNSYAEMPPEYLPGGAGQPCLWWSQGCSIGCSMCATNLTDGKIPVGPITGNAPHTDKAGFRKSYWSVTQDNDHDLIYQSQAWRACG